MSDAQGGNVLVLFPSYEFLEQVARRMPGLAPRCRCNGRIRRNTSGTRFCKTLAVGDARGVLLFAVLGGMYAEGVDYPGELLDWRVCGFAGVAESFV